MHKGQQEYLGRAKNVFNNNQPSPKKGTGERKQKGNNGGHASHRPGGNGRGKGWAGAAQPPTCLE